MTFHVEYLNLTRLIRNGALIRWLNYS